MKSAKVMEVAYPFLGSYIVFPFQLCSLAVSLAFANHFVLDIEVKPFKE